MSPNRGIDSLSDGNVRLLNNNADKTDEINKNFCPTARKRVNGDDMVDDMSIPISSQKNSIPSTEIRYFTVSRTGYFALKLYEKKRKKKTSNNQPLNNSSLYCLCQFCSTSWCMEEEEPSMWHFVQTM